MKSSCPVLGVLKIRKQAEIAAAVFWQQFTLRLHLLSNRLEGQHGFATLHSQYV